MAATFARSILGQRRPEIIPHYVRQIPLIVAANHNFQNRFCDPSFSQHAAVMYPPAVEGTTTLLCWMLSVSEFSLHAGYECSKHGLQDCEPRPPGAREPFLNKKPMKKNQDLSWNMIRWFSPHLWKSCWLLMQYEGSPGGDPDENDKCTC